MPAFIKEFHPRTSISIRYPAIRSWEWRIKAQEFSCPGAPAIYGNVRLAIQESLLGTKMGRGDFLTGQLLRFEQLSPGELGVDLLQGGETHTLIAVNNCLPMNSVAIPPQDRTGEFDEIGDSTSIRLPRNPEFKIVVSVVALDAILVVNCFALQGRQCQPYFPWIFSEPQTLHLFMGFLDSLA